MRNRDGWRDGGPRVLPVLPAGSGAASKSTAAETWAEWGGFSRSTKMSEFEIVLRSHVIRGNSKSGASEFLDELTLAFKRNKEKGELWEMNTSKGSQVINLSQLQIAEAWEKDD